MLKYNIEIDVTKISKDKLVQKEYTNKEGEIVKQTLLKATVVLNKETILKETDTYILKEVGFVAEQSAKEEKSNYIGKVLQFENKGESKASTNNDVSDENLPF